MKKITLLFTLAITLLFCLLLAGLIALAALPARRPVDEPVRHQQSAVLAWLEAEAASAPPAEQ